jgi:hypothetical protein
VSEFDRGVVRLDLNRNGSRWPKRFSNSVFKGRGNAKPPSCQPPNKLLEDLE